jgi:phage shock protein A
MPSYEDDLIRRARELQRLATKRRRLKRQLKQVDLDIKKARKDLNAVKQASEGRRPDAAPSRLHAGVTSVGTLHTELPDSKEKAS